MRTTKKKITTAYNSAIIKTYEDKKNRVSINFVVSENNSKMCYR